MSARRVPPSLEPQMFDATLKILVLRALLATPACKGGVSHACNNNSKKVPCRP